MYLLLYIVAINYYSTIISGEVTCKSTGPCSCSLSNGGGTIDLSPINKFKKPPIFTVVSVGTETQFDPCREFTCGSDTTHVCMVNSGVIPPMQQAIGNDVKYNYDEDSKLITFEYTQGSFATFVEMHCEAGLSGAGKLNKVTQKSGSKFFYASLDSQYACLVESKHKNKLSTGTVLCILFVVFVFLYIVVGVLVNKYFRKLEGEEIFPNLKFWKDFPSLVKDGSSFLWSLRPNRGEYNTM